jgi:AcrR family transcriptional regulator
MQCIQSKYAMYTSSRYISPVDEKNRPYHHGDLREVLLREAKGLLEEVDPAEVSLREIARRAGVSPRAPYRHFESRDALLAAIAANGFRQITAAFDEIPTSNDLDRLKKMGRAYVDFARAERPVFELMFSPLIRHDDVQVASATAFERLVAATRPLAPAGSTLKDWIRFATSIWSGLHGIATIGNDGVGELYTSEVFVSPEEIIEALCFGWAKAQAMCQTISP